MDTEHFESCGPTALDDALKGLSASALVAASGIAGMGMAASMLESAIEAELDGLRASFERAFGFSAMTPDPVTHREVRGAPSEVGLPILPPAETPAPAPATPAGR